jgi:hypothetical protein
MCSGVLIGFAEIKLIGSPNKSGKRKQTLIKTPITSTNLKMSFIE